MIETIKPMEIEKRSFAIITELLGDRVFPPEQEPIIKRVIHTTADFDYADQLAFSADAVQSGLEALRRGCDIVTDTQMAKAGINKTILGRLGGQVHCFMSDADVAAEAQRRGITRAIVSMEKAVHFCHRQCAHSPDRAGHADPGWKTASGAGHRRAGGLCQCGGEQKPDPAVRCALYRGPGPKRGQQRGGGYLQCAAVPDHTVMRWNNTLQKAANGCGWGIPPGPAQRLLQRLLHGCF